MVVVAGLPDRFSVLRRATTCRGRLFPPSSGHRGFIRPDHRRQGILFQRSKGPVGRRADTTSRVPTHIRPSCLDLKKDMDMIWHDHRMENGHTGAVDGNLIQFLPCDLSQFGGPPRPIPCDAPKGALSPVRTCGHKIHPVPAVIIVLKAGMLSLRTLFHHTSSPKRDHLLASVIFTSRNWPRADLSPTTRTRRLPGVRAVRSYRVSSDSPSMRHRTVLPT